MSEQTAKFYARSRAGRVRIRDMPTNTPQSKRWDYKMVDLGDDPKPFYFADLEEIQKDPEVVVTLLVAEAKAEEKPEEVAVAEKPARKYNRRRY